MVVKHIRIVGSIDDKNLSHIYTGPLDEFKSCTINSVMFITIGVETVDLPERYCSDEVTYDDEDSDDE